MWERRYGVPVPVRLASGHRRYTTEQVILLRRVAEAMALGHRPGELLRTSPEELDALLQRESRVERVPEEVERWLELVRGSQPRELQAALQTAAGELDPVTFLESRISPLLHAIGREWADGDVEIRHEHLATHAVEDFLRSQRVALSQRPEAGRRGLIVLATLPGEQHALGLEMAAVLCESLGVRTWILGTDTPLAQIAASVLESGARAVGVSVSLAAAGVQNDSVLAQLRDQLPEGTRLVVGGRSTRGKRRKLPGVAYCRDLEALRRWLEDEFPPRDEPAAGETPA